DGGVEGLVLRMAVRGVSSRQTGSAVTLRAAAGEPWDDLVRLAVERGWAGLECLSGIPGLVGATPVQNVGAYGQEVSDTVTAVRALDCASGEVVSLAPPACRFAYRDSVFRTGEPGRYVVLSVEYRLRGGGPPTLAYADVERHLAGRGIASPTLADVRASVLAIRRAKSMVLEDGDPNRRSCGSFFLNPIVAPVELARIERLVGDPAMPRWPQPDGRVKLSAAWLIEHAGFRRGEREGSVGLSTRHALSIVAHDGAQARDVVGFAHRIQAAVEQRCGVRLSPEPILWGAEPAQATR
ncbi:MAG: UDP-N-acetylmuramate dehydrogenase, partial [Candidatus Rokubacteria bacterium]|nr:UDP-N-acetylmuramate dehydrogenase [Candidatus Rokubacteria bacterium]